MDVAGNDILLSNSRLEMAADCPIPGLFKGNAGMAIVAYLMSSWDEGGYSALKSGAILLEKISENAGSVSDAGFANGLAGIGWAIEWLAQNKMLKGVNTDEVLSDVDDMLYRKTVASKQDEACLTTGAIGVAAYFIKRSRSRNAGVHRYRELCHQECISMLADDIDGLFRGPEGPMSMQISRVDGVTDLKTRQHIMDLGSYLCVFARSASVNRAVIGEMLLDCMALIERLLDDLLTRESSISLLKQDRDLYWCLFYLSVCYLFFGDLRGHPHWLERSDFYTATFHSMNGDVENETFSNLFRMLSIYTLLNIYRPSLLYKMKLEQAIIKLRSADQPLELYNGWGSLVIAELSLLRPGIINSWQEILFI